DDVDLPRNKKKSPSKKQGSGSKRKSGRGKSKQYPSFLQVVEEDESGPVAATGTAAASGRDHENTPSWSAGDDEQGNYHSVGGSRPGEETEPRLGDHTGNSVTDSDASQEE
ncbi:unnamed protein product, partial [Amoebophrya sp. A120]